MLWKYLHHLVNQAKESSSHVNSYSFLDPEGFYQLTRKEFMTWRLEHSSQQTNPNTGSGPRGYTQKDSRCESNQCAHQLLAFKKSIKRDVSHYITLKDEKYLRPSR